MKKLFTMIGAAALLIGAYQPANADIAGTHTLTATVEWTNPADKDVLGQYLDVPKTFTITGSGSSFELGNFLGNSWSTISLKYSDGTLSFQNGNLGSYTDFDTWASYGFGIANIEGEYKATSPTVCFKVDADNNITLPDFTIVDTGKGNAIIAKYTNVKIDGYPKGGETEQPVEYPENVKGIYSFKGDMYYFNDTYSGVKADIPTSFDFTVETSYIDNFLGYDGYLYYSYDKATGIITITANRLKDTSVYLPGTFMGVQLGLSDATGSWPGLKNNGGEILKIQVNADGSLSIPEFTVVDRNNGNPVIARFNSCVATKAGGSEGGDQPGGETGEFVPVNPELGDYEVLGSYIWTITPTPDLFTKEANVDILVDVLKTSDEKYFVKESADTDYFKGSIIPFTYQDGAQTATFEQFLAGHAGDTPVLFSPFLSTPEINPQFLFLYNVKDGFTFNNGQQGFGWFNSKKEDGLDPTYEYVSLFYLVSCETVAEPETFPAIGEFDGNYVYQCADFTLVDQSQGTTYKANVPFTIETLSGIVNVKNFFGLTSTGASYEPETGTLTLNTNYWRDGATWIGIAPNGEWKGLSGNKLNIQIAADCTVSIPDFNVVTFSGATQLSVLAEYRNGVVVTDDGQGGGQEEEKSFAGTYALKGTKYEYPDGISAEPVKSALNFDLVINENNQVTAIGGYTLSDEEINTNKRNQGQVVENQLILEAAPFVGVLWNQIEIEDSPYTESYLLGGPGIKEWDQLDPTNKVVFTLEEDGTYYLAPFTLWHRYPKQVVGEGDQTNTQITTELVFKWDDTAFSEFADPTMEGFWSIPLNDHYQDSSSLKEFTADYAVTVDGNQVKFNDSDKYDIVGEFVDATTIRFSKTKLVSAKFSLTQVPYFNNDGTNDIDELEFKDFTATYDAENGTITFPENSGIAYLYLDENGEVGEYTEKAAFDFNGTGVKTGDFVPTLTIANVGYQLTGNKAVVTASVTPGNFTEADAAEWKVNLTEMFQDNDLEKDWTENSTLDATVSNGKLTFEIPELAAGNHDFKFSLTANDNNGKEIATSNERALSFVAGASAAIRNIKTEVSDVMIIDGVRHLGSITVTFDATLSGIDTETATYKVQFTDNTAVAAAIDSNATLVGATIENGVVTATLTELETGKYDYTVALVVYNDDEEVAVSNNLQFVANVSETTGVNDIITDGQGSSRYFNLNGVEVVNPQTGSILIKVTNGKTTKVLVK